MKRLNRINKLFLQMKKLFPQLKCHATSKIIPLEIYRRN